MQKSSLVLSSDFALLLQSIFAVGSNPTTLVSRASGFSNNLLHLVDLPLGTTHGTEPLLRQLPCPLILRIPQQFDNATLIRGETSNFLDDLTNKSCAAREMSLRSANAGLGFDWCCFMALVQANSDPGAFFRHHNGW